MLFRSAQAALAAAAYVLVSGACVYVAPSLAGLTRSYVRLAMDILTRRGRPVAV